MKILYTVFLAVFFLLDSTHIVHAQDVHITLPTSSIFNRSEFTTVQTVMNTQGNSSWRSTGVDPYVRSSSGEFFIHTSAPTTTLPTSVLQWQLATIGGQQAPFRSGDVLPGYKWFTSSYQTWYQPTASSRYNAGNVAFRFRIPSSQIEANAFYAGDYKIQIAQDYGRSGWYAIEFSPESFTTFITIPEDIRWLLGSTSNYVTINSLNEFRTGAQFAINLGTMEIGHTIDFDLFAKSEKKVVQFKALNGKNRKFDVSVVQLGSNQPKILTMALEKNEKNYSAAGGFKVERGNRANFELQLLVNNEDFRNYFFEAGTYTFQVNLNAKASNGSSNSTKEVDVTVVVPFLSEITIPGGNTEVNFLFNTVQQYNEGQTKVIPNQIRVSNNENYELYVKSDANYFYSNGIQTNINSDVLEIGIEGNSKRIPLSKSSQILISNGSPEIDKNLNLNYSISAISAQSLIPKEKKSYSINVIYSFTAL